MSRPSRVAPADVHSSERVSASRERRQPIHRYPVEGRIRAEVGAVGVPLDVERLTGARKVHVVELVVAELEEILAVVVLRLNEIGIAEIVVGQAVDPVHADANFAPIAEVAPDVEVAFDFSIAKVSDA